MRTARTTLEYIVGSKARAHVLRRLLHPRDELAWFRSVTKGHNSVSGVQRELDRLAALGLVRSSFAAGGRFIDVCESHPLVAALRELVETADGLDPPGSGWTEPDPLWERARRCGAPPRRGRSPEDKPEPPVRSC